MNIEAAQDLITAQIAVFGLSALAILGALLTLIVGFLVFRWGWKKLSNSAGEPTYMSSYDGINFDAVSAATRKAIRQSYPKNTEGI